MAADSDVARLEGRFNEAMVLICDEAKRRYGYTPTRFLQMLGDRSGVEVARSLTLSPDASDGFTRLSELKALHLTVEVHVLKPEYAALFTDADREAARKRLELYGWTPS